jgi:outer membrane receptor for ferrienterochelin and colicins
VLDERQRWRTGGFYNFGDNRQLSARATAMWQRGRHRFTPSTSASIFDHLSRASSEPSPFADDAGQRQVQRVYQAELLYNGHVGSNTSNMLDVGVQVRRDETVSERVEGGLRSMLLIEPFAQLALAPSDQFTVTPGVRVSRSAQWGTRATPRVAARWVLGDVTLRGSLGEGFRVPDFKELYMFFQNTSAGYAVLGNVDLRPESSRNATVGAEWRLSGGYARTQLFANRFRGFIETRPVTAPGEAPVYRYVNVDNGMTRGVDVEAGYALASIRVEAGYSLLDTRDDASDSPLLGRPTHSGRLSIVHSLPWKIRSSVSATATGRTPMQRDTSNQVVTSWRESFARVDARFARALPMGMEIVFGANNLFDRRPAEWADFTTRHFYTAFSWNYNRSNQ